jgi:uridine kinase
MPADPSRAARHVAEQVLARPPTLGPGRLVCVDGPAGSGKTTLAGAVADVVPGSVVVHCDELLQGWGGMSGLASTVEKLLAPLAAGRSSAWRRWDWLADGWAETHPVEPGGLLVLEGVGSWSPAIADVVGFLVWVEAASELRLARGIERDGEAMRPHWMRWRIEEDQMFERFGTRSHADLVVVTD